MTQRYDTSIMPQADILRVCMSCWRRVPSILSRQIHHHRFPDSTPLTCNGSCGSRWQSAASGTTRAFCTSSNKADENDITKNPFYEKYQKKLQYLKEENPGEYEARMEDLGEKKKKAKQPVVPPPGTDEVEKKPDLPGYTGPRSWPPQSLDEILKLDLVKDLSSDAITALWQEHHLAKDCVFSVVPAVEYEEIITKSKLNPTFLFPLPKSDGFEFYLCQFSGKDVFFTSLGMYQLVKENAPPCLSLAHFPELKEDKGIVLMAGEYDSKVITKAEALNLVKQMALYYGQDAGDKYKLLRLFSSEPDSFDYMSTIEVYKMNKETLENNPY